MIRINLLGVREQAPGVFEGEVPATPSEKKGLLFAILLIGAALALIAFQYLTAQQTLSRLDEEINQLTQEKQRLAAIIQRVNEYQQRLQELEKREALIERLKREREGPVRMLDDLSASASRFRVAHESNLGRKQRHCSGYGCFLDQHCGLHPEVGAKRLVLQRRADRRPTRV